MRYFAAVLENLIATSSVNVLHVDDNPPGHLQRKQTPECISCIALHTVVLVRQLGKRVGWAQCVKVMTTGSALHGHEGTRVGIALARGAALHNHKHKARRCTSYAVATKWKVLLTLGVAWATAQGGARGHAHGVHTTTSMRRVPWQFPNPTTLELHHSLPHTGRRTSKPLQKCLPNLLRWWLEEKGVTRDSHCNVERPGTIVCSHPAINSHASTKNHTQKRGLRNGV